MKNKLLSEYVDKWQGVDDEGAVLKTWSATCELRFVFSRVYDHTRRPETSQSSSANCQHTWYQLDINNHANPVR